ncbi:MAG: molybdopterin-dependent oxidoreductase, partial [bacterium]|nr:molybdopterin-dependent oxidoreductase [bacterium]
MSNFKYIGKSSVRIDGKEKVSGAAQYVDDIDFGAKLLYAAVVESPYAYARINGIDTSEAEKIEGVVRVVTGKEFPYRFGLYMHDRYIFAQDSVRFIGEQVAAVIARDPATAKKAAKAVKVDYTEFEPLLDVESALKKEGRKIHPDLGNYEHVPWFFPQEDTNIAHHRKIRKGDTEAAFKDADFVFEDTYQVPRYAHCAIEVHAAVGLADFSGRLTMWTASQSPHTQRHLFTEALAPLGYTHKDVRVITPHVGGGFGGKAGVSMDLIVAALATVVKGSSVKVLWLREQEFYNTYQRQGVHARIKMG